MLYSHPLKVFLFILHFVILASSGAAQKQTLDSLDQIMHSNEHDTTRINAAIEKAAILEYSDFDAAHEAAEFALKTSKQTNYVKGIFNSYYAFASMHYENIRPDVMHVYIDSMMAMNDPSITDNMMADAFNLQGIAYYVQNNLIEAISAWKQARALYPPDQRAGVISNIGNIYLSSDELEKALDYFLDAAAINEKSKHLNYLTVNFLNIAACYPNNDTLRLHYLNKSEKNARLAGYYRALPEIYDRKINYHSVNNQFAQATICFDTLRSYEDMAGPDFESYYIAPLLATYRYHLAKAKLNGSEYGSDIIDGAESPGRLLRLAAEFYTTEIESQENLRTLMYEHQVLGDIYSELGEHELSVKSYQSSLAFKDSLAMNKAKFILKEYELNQKAAEERERKLKAENERQRQAFRFYAALTVVGIVILLALVLLGRLRLVRRARKTIQREKDISEGLLLNILPEEVAEELKANGEAEAKLFDEVTVLFTDFKGFTAISEQLKPQELVSDLNTYFSEFDRIISKYNIEKIKTIGDAYMATGGLPLPNTTHAQDVVKAALEMVQVIEQGKAKKIAAGLPFFEIRIGVHTGPVVAGIVGVKKFQYDIWGDTVNIASRMESSGEVSKVNISKSTYELIKNDTEFVFESRGMIEAKGKGKMDMYFVSKA